jgi:hypothetical protein
MVEQYLSDNSTDILFQSAANVTWVPYNKFHVGDYEKAHHDKIRDVVVLQIKSKENTFTRAIMHRWTMTSCNWKIPAIEKYRHNLPKSSSAL